MSEASFFSKIDKVPNEEKQQIAVSENSPSEKSFFSKVDALNPENEQAKFNLNITQDLSPDQEAENYKLSKDSGIPTSIVREDPAKVKKMIDAPAFGQIDPSKLKNYYSRFQNAAISRDDEEELVNIQTTWDKTKQSFEEGKVDTLINYWTARRELLGFDPNIANEQIRKLEEQRAQFEPFEAEGFFEKVLTATSRQIPQQILAAEKGLERAPLGAVVGAAGAAALGLLEPSPLEEVVTFPLLATAAAGAGQGFIVGRAESMFYQEFGGAFREFTEIKDEQGNPLDPNIAKVMALGVGGVNASLEFASFKAVVKTFPGGDKIFSKINSKLIKEVVKSPTIRKKLTDIALRAGTAWTTEIATEVLQEISNVIFGEIGKKLQERTTDAEFKGFEWDAFFTRLGAIASETAYSALGFMLPGTAVSTGKAVADSTISKKFHDDNNQMKEVIDQSKTQQRSPDHSEQFLEIIGMGQPVYISPEGIELLYQENTKDEADAILKKVGLNPEKTKATAATGEDIEVIHSKALSQLPREEFDKISKDMKPAPSGYTQRDIEQGIDQDDVEATVKVFAEETKRQREINQEITRIQEEGKKAGLTEETVETTPALMKGLANRLSLEDVDPVAFLKKIGIKKTTLEEIKGFFQPEKGAPPRAAIPLTNESHLINLFEGADLSSVLHEVGHIALKEYNNLEVTRQASEELIKDMNAFRKFVGAKKGQEFTRTQSEQFARGFEAYLMEGKAPTVELASAFERFKRWLLETYKTVKSLDVTLNNDVRQAFDRMLSANLEVEAIAQTKGFTIKTVDEMKALGMNDADQKFAKFQIEKTVRKAKQRLTKARNTGYRENVKEWREEARREIRNENPTYKTMSSIVADGNQIDRDEFVERYGEEAIKLLPTTRILKKRVGDKGGQSMDMVAAFYGYDDYIEMINAFFDTPKFSVAVDQRVNNKVLAHDAQFSAEDFIVDLPEYRQYLNIISRNINNKGVDEATLEAGIERNRGRWETKATEEIQSESPELEGAELNNAIEARIDEKIEAFRKKQGKPSIISSARIKQLAKDTMNAKTVRDARAQHIYLSAMKKAASDERRAILRKDWDAASKANELQRFNYEMASLSKNAKDEVNVVLKRAKRTGKSKVIDFEHREAILHLINRYNLASLVPSKPELIPEYNKLFAGDDYGNDGYQVPDFLFSNTAKDFRDLTLEQFKDLDNAIRYLAGQGNIGKKDTLSDGETLLQDVIDKSVAVQSTVKRLKVWEKGSLMRRITDPARKFFSLFDSLTFEMKSVDGYTNLGKDGKVGPAEQFVMNPIKDGLDALTLQNKEISEQLAPHLKQISKTIRKWHKQFGNNIRIKGAPVPSLMRADGQTNGWRAQQIFAVVLNTGNIGETSNYANLLAGYPDLTPGIVETIKDMLSQKDMDAMQGIWNIINSLFKQVDEQHIKIKNYGMSKVEATPFNFKGKEYQGGYYPIRHDRNLSYAVEDRGRVEDLFNNEAAKIQVPYTKSGQTIKRLRGAALPILLDLSVIDSHINDTLHYIHLTDVVKDADRITRSHDFRAAAIRILGKDVYNTIRPALQHIANPKRAGLDQPGARPVEWMRGLSTLYVLAWNTGVAIKQPLSTFGAIRDMGFRAYIDGFSSTLMSPSVHYQKMIDLSPYMRDRLKSFDRELRSAFLKLTKEQRGIYFGDTKVTWQDVKNFGFWQIRVADTVTVLPIWHGAFNDKLNADQSNLEEATRYADDLVRNSQPSAQPLDLSTWQRDGGIIRLFSQFQTFTVGKYGQRQRLHYRAWRNKSISTLDYAWFNFMDAFLPLAAINMLQAIIWGRDLEDDETQLDILFEIVQGWALMGVPFARNIVRAVTGYGNPIDSPVLQAGNKAVQGVIKGARGLNGFKNRKEREAALWGIGHTISILSGVPVSKIVSRAERGAKAKDAAPGIKYLIPPPRGK
jgi:hypothetical protein